MQKLVFVEDNLDDKIYSELTKEISQLCNDLELLRNLHQDFGATIIRQGEKIDSIETKSIIVDNNITETVSNLSVAADYVQRNRSEIIIAGGTVLGIVIGGPVGGLLLGHLGFVIGGLSAGLLGGGFTWKLSDGVFSGPSPAEKSLNDKKTS